MKHKKLIALLATLTLGMSSMTAMAETIEGDVNYVNTTVYKVTLPTTAGMSFTLDPQGLTSLDAGAYDGSAAGKIISTGTMTAVNESSVAVTLTADFYLEDTDSASLTLKSEGDTFTTDSNSKESSKEIKLVVETDDATAGNISVTSTAAGTGTDFTMAAATYTYGGNAEDGYTYDLTAGSGSEVNMTITGAVAKDYDWSAYTDDADTPATLTLNAVFKFTNAAGDEIDAEVVAPAPTAAVSTWDGGSDLWVAIDDNGGLVDESLLTSVQIKDDTMAALANVNYTVDEAQGWMTIAWDDIIAAGGGDAATSWTVQFVYDETTYAVTNTGE